MDSVEDRWHALPLGARSALEEQWRGVGDRALPCGAAVTDAQQRLVSVGRNRAYDARTGTSPLERTRIAHAELNALAQVGTDADWAPMTLWCTQHPCAMCAAAVAFTGIGHVVVIASDPSDDSPPADIEATRRGAEYTPLGDPYWWVVSTLLFLATGAQEKGADDGNVRLAALRMPGTAALAVELAEADALGAAARDGLSLPDGIRPFDAAITELLHEAD
jgi:tRNA(Arg) A34 adenosine deaminase TadA